jgi:hypothetical protein
MSHCFGHVDFGRCKKNAADVKWFILGRLRQPVGSRNGTAILSGEAAMFDTIVAKWSGISRTAPVVIPLDRPDLMADAGYEGLRYQGPGPRGRVRDHWLAASWMPFHVAAG